MAREHSLRRRAPAFYTHLRNVAKGHPPGILPEWANLSTMDEFYRLARKLTLETGIKHHVDHIIPLKGRFKGGEVQIVTGLHVHHNLRVVSALDNMRKWCWLDE